VTWGFTDLDTLKAHSPDMLFESVDEILSALVG
jgi:phosphoglycolate phosphatase-like HAD superfamily hydrolase